MARNNEILARRSDWKGKATILAISLDHAPELARDHMKKNGWTHIPSFWAPMTMDSDTYSPLDADAPRRFGVTSIPSTFLIDKHGVLRAHGNDLDPETSLDALLDE